MVSLTKFGSLNLIIRSFLFAILSSIAMYKNKKLKEFHGKLNQIIPHTIRKCLIQIDFVSSHQNKKIYTKAVKDKYLEKQTCRILAL